MPVRSKAPKPTAHPTALTAILARISSVRDSLGNTAQRIADFIVAEPEQVVYMSVSEVAERCSASEGSVGADHGPSLNV